jgi:hypothetical protein
MPTYQPNIPTGSVKFNQDYLNVQGNFQQLNIAYGFDHVPFSNTSGLPPAPGGQSGLHKVVHLLANSTIATNPATNYPITPPTPVPLTGEIFTTQSNDGIATDTILWYLSEAGRLTQLTSNFVPVASNNGYTFLPGGLILQWGQVTSTSTSQQTVTFATNNISFPNNCFAVFAQPYGSGNLAGSQATIQIRKSTISNLSFQWRYITNSGEWTGFFWVAIGN